MIGFGAKMRTQKVVALFNKNHPDRHPINQSMNLKSTPNPVICAKCEVDSNQMDNFLRVTQNVQQAINEYMSINCKPLLFNNDLRIISAEKRDIILTATLGSHSETDIIDLSIEQEKILSFINSSNTTLFRESIGTQSTINTDVSELIESNMKVEYKEIVKRESSLETKKHSTRKSKQEKMAVKRSKYICYYCREEFSGRVPFLGHIKKLHNRNVEVDTYKCNLCDFESSSKVHFQRHMKHIHRKEEKCVQTKEEIHKCYLCSYPTTSMSDLKSHWMYTHEISDILHKRFLCNNDTPSRSRLTSYLASKHNKVYGNKNQTPITKPEYECTHCECKSYTTYHLAKRHSENRNRTLFTCGFCKYKTGMKIYIIRHLRDFHFKKSHKCKECDYESEHKLMLGNHEMTHEEDMSKVHICGQCHYRTQDSWNMRTHIEMHHCKETKNELYKCSQCDVEMHAADFSTIFHPFFPLGDQP